MEKLKKKYCRGRQVWNLFAQSSGGIRSSFVGIRARVMIYYEEKRLLLANTASTSSRSELSARYIYRETILQFNAVALHLLFVSLPYFRHFSLIRARLDERDKWRFLSRIHTHLKTLMFLFSAVSKSEK